jgi:putative ATP-binding cassette transporter
MDPYPGQSTEQPPGSCQRTAWQLIKSYWQSEQRFPAYLFLSIVCLMTVPLIIVNVFFTYEYNYFYEVLQEYDKQTTVRFFSVILILTACYFMWAIYRFYISRLFRSRLHHWLTEKCINRWLQKTRNPSQYIRDDIAALIHFSIDLSLGLIGTVATFFALIYILWQLSDELDISLGGFGTIHVTNYLIWVGVIYALIETFLTFTRAPRQVSVKPSGRVRFLSPLGKLRQKMLSWFKSGYCQMTLILPILVVLPTFLDKIILISWLIQYVRAFTRVQIFLSSTVNATARVEKEIQ